MASVFLTVYEAAAEVALGDPIQFAEATIDGANSVPITGDARKRRRVRVLADANCFIAYGAAPPATNGTDAMPLGLENPEYIDIEAGHVLTAVSR